MKKHLLFLSFLFVSLVVFAGKFVLIPVSETNNLETLFAHNDLKIHYYCDDYVLATTTHLDFKNLVVLDENAFGDVGYYVKVYCLEKNKREYLDNIKTSAKVLYSGSNFLIMKILSDGFFPAKNDGMVSIRNVEAVLSKTRFDYPVVTEVDETVQEFVNQVSSDRLIADVQHLQNYLTRRYNKPEALQAQNWIKAQFESMNLSTSIQNLSSHNPSWMCWCSNWSSGNVIAIQKGVDSTYWDEYIVCGAHYDSYTYSGNEPGADDNATGTAGVLETARLLSQYDFKRSIIYCTFTAEECGLDGSWNYAKQCKNQGMNIVGYFNIDMSGYLEPGTNIHIDLIHPTTANPLANYYKNIANIYFPGIPVTSYPNLSGGDSDHTSFNQNGYMGIFPFEDNVAHSPHIHTSNDIIGPSVNSPEQVKVFTQINLASIATLAIFYEEEEPPPPPPINPPTKCETEVVEGMCIKVTWEEPEEVIPNEYIVYRDSVNIAQTTELFYLDTVADYGEYCYMITAIYLEEESEFSNESCAEIVPVTHTFYPPTHCVAEYLEEMCIKITWDAPEEETPDEYYVYRDSVGIAKCVELFYIDTVTDYLQHCYLVTAIYDVYESEFSEESCTQVPVKITNYESQITVFPNPTNGKLSIVNCQLSINNVEIYDVMGKKVSSNHLITTSSNHQIDISHLSNGIYFVKIYTDAGYEVAKFIKE